MTAREAFERYRSMWLILTKQALWEWDELPRQCVETWAYVAEGAIFDPSILDPVLRHKLDEAMRGQAALKETLGTAREEIANLRLANRDLEKKLTAAQRERRETDKTRLLQGQVAVLQKQIEDFRKYVVALRKYVRTVRIHSPIRAEEIFRTASGFDEPGTLLAQDREQAWQIHQAIESGSDEQDFPQPGRPPWLNHAPHLRQRMKTSDTRH